MASEARASYGFVARGLRGRNRHPRHGSGEVAPPRCIARIQAKLERSARDDGRLEHQQPPPPASAPPPSSKPARVSTYPHSSSLMARTTPRFQSALACSQRQLGASAGFLYGRRPAPGVVLADARPGEVRSDRDYFIVRACSITTNTFKISKRESFFDQQVIENRSVGRVLFLIFLARALLCLP